MGFPTNPGNSSKADPGVGRLKIGPGPPIVYPCPPIDRTRLNFTDYRSIVDSWRQYSAQIDKEVGEMSDMTNTTAESSDKYFLQEQELWENLGFDWEGWNQTVEKILQQQSSASSTGKEYDRRPEVLAPQTVTNP